MGTVEQTRCRCHALALPTIRCDNEGQPAGPRAIDALDDPALEAALASDACVARLRELASAWGAEDLPHPDDLIPGLMAMPIVLTERRRRAGHLVALARIVDTSAREIARLLAGWSDARDTELVVAVGKIAAHTRESVSTIAALLHWAQDDASELLTRDGALDELSTHLSESYEEVMLLYKLSRFMTELAAPDRFVEQACAELHATMRFAWVGAAFVSDNSLAREMAGRRVIHGEPGAFSDGIRSMLGVALGEADSSPTPTLSSDEIASEAGLTPTGDVALSRVLRGDRLVGVIAAGEKQGVDQDISSADLKLLDAAATSMGVFFENASLYDEQHAMFLGVLQALTAAIDAKDRYTCGHSERVAHLAVALARRLAFDDETTERLRVCGLVHDIGKIGVPEAVLSKPGRLTDEEFAIVKRHPEIGVRILRDLPQLADVLPGVMHHHERWDGRGYPHGLAGEKIPLFARLLALADSFDAMSSTRTYREAMPRSVVLEEIRRNTGTQFDPAFAGVFMKLDFLDYDRMVERHRRRDPPIEGAREVAA